METIILNFIFNGEEIKIQCKKGEYMKEIFKKYVIKINKDIKELYFLFKGGKINEELKLEEIQDI